MTTAAKTLERIMRILDSEKTNKKKVRQIEDCMADFLEDISPQMTFTFTDEVIDHE